MTCAQQADEMRPFNLLISREPGGGPRLGRLLLRHGHAIETPHYLAITSRGVVPHLSQDNLQRHTNIKAAYLGLEDCKSCSITAGHPAKADKLPLTEAPKS